MKHLFWIVCGVLCLGLLVAWVAMVPGDDARASKKKIDDQSRELLNLDKRAHNKLAGVFDLEKPDDIKRLHDDFLITPSWKPVLESFQTKYESQLQQMQKQLLARTDFLKKEVAPSTDFSAWYSAYVKSSEALVKRLKEAGCLKLPKTAAAAVAAEESAGDESPAELRRMAGLYTKAGALPEPKEHPLLTARLHIMEMLADRLVAAKIAIADNPANGPTGRADERAGATANLIAVDWAAPVTGSDFGHPVATPISDLLGTQAVSLKLTLDGPLSALLSAVAILDRNSDADRPLVALGSTTLTRRSDFAAGDRDDVAAEPVRLELGVSIIYFTDTPIAMTPDAGGGMGGGPPGMMPGGFPGMPGGFPGGPPGAPNGGKH